MSSFVDYNDYPYYPVQRPRRDRFGFFSIWKRALARPARDQIDLNCPYCVDCVTLENGAFKSTAQPHVEDFLEYCAECAAAACVPEKHTKTKKPSKPKKPGPWGEWCPSDDLRYFWRGRQMPNGDWDYQFRPAVYPASAKTKFAYSSPGPSSFLGKKTYVGEETRESRGRDSMSSVQETSTDAETADAGGLTENEAATSSGPEATSSTSGSAPIGTEPSLSNGTEASESAEDADSQTSTTFASIPCFVAREETDDTPPVPLLYRTIPKDKSQAKPPKTKKGQQKKQQRAGRPKKISPKARYGKDGKVDNKTKINRWRVDVMLPPMSP